MFRSAAWSVAFVVGIGLSLPRAAGAQDAESPPDELPTEPTQVETPPEPVTPPPADASHDAEARALFQAGSTALDAGRFEDALAHFERSYELSPHAGLLYNIGLAAATIDHRERAIEAFEGFLRQEATSDRRSEVVARLRVLRAGVAASRVTPVAPARRRQSAAPWITLGVSSAAVAAGTALFVAGLTANSNIAHAADGTPWATVSSDYDRGRMFTTIGVIAGAVGVAGAAASIVWLVADGDGGERVQVSAGVGRIDVAGRF